MTCVIITAGKYKGALFVIHGDLAERCRTLGPDGMVQCDPVGPGTWRVLRLDRMREATSMEVELMSNPGHCRSGGCAT